MFTDDPPIREAETSHVQLTRIEGTINLIKYQNEAMAKRMGDLEVSVGKLKTDVHTLQLEAVARDRLAVTVATTLKDSDAALIVKNDQKWSPVTRLVAITSIILYVTTVFFLFHR